MFSIFHEDAFNQEESTEDSANANDLLDLNRDTVSSNVNIAHYSFMRENIQDQGSSGLHLQQSTDDSRAYQSKNYDCFEESVYSEGSDSDSYNNEMFNYDLLPGNKRYKTENSDYSTTATSFENWDVVKCREYVDHVANSCFSAVLKKIEQIKSLSKRSQSHHSQNFIDRISNLNNQQIEFERFVSTVKAQFNLVNTQNEKFEKTIESIQRESLIFQQFFPAYGFRLKILDAVEKSQVVIINSSQTYSSNVALPLILSNTYPEFSVIACEPNEILSHILQENINFAMSHCDTQTHVLSENQLLKHCSYSTYFAENESCIIVNVSLKRSVTADIILSDLRDLLITQKHSKLVLLLSPQDNPSKFADYFSSKLKVSVLKFPDLFLPIKTIWKSAMSYPQDDFKDDLIKTIFSVHAAYREQGDIVAFLPCLEDVQCVNEKIELENHCYQYNLKVICMEDDLDYISKSVMNLSNSSERKIFLLTNNYEVLPIPSARFIIDCGIQKESYFDLQTDTNVVIPTFISQARAKMRKYLAGVHNTGVCFRLFNKANYLKNMYQKEHAEIFCINPIQSIVMALQHCPQKKKSIQFVESLPGDVFQNTLNTLRAYGAIDKDLSLTSFGENIVKLPLPLKYSRFILHGIQSGFAFEAIILVAFFSIKSKLFVDAADNEHQRLIDLMKLDFNQSDSDTLTYLNIYKLWKKSGFKKVWCMEHFLNFDTLKSIRCKINEIIHLVPQRLGQEVLQQFSEGSNQNYLIQMLFECFHSNCCSYSGHPRTGYRILSSGKYAMIHASSFLSQKDDFPDFVIFEDSTSSDPIYIKHLTSISFDIIADYSQQNKLNFDTSALFDYKLVKKAIDSVGDKVISRFLPKNDKKKIEEVENKLKKKTNAPVVLIEPILEKGSVNFYAFPDDIDRCFVALKDILSDYTQTMTNEEEYKIIEFTHGQNRASFEIKWIKGAETICAKYILISSNLAVKNSASCNLESISEPSSDSSSINYTLKVSWPRLVCTGEGSINFKNQNDFQRARLLAFKNVKIDDYEVFVQISNLGKHQLSVSQIPSVVTKTDIENTFSSLLPGCRFEVELCYTPPFETNDSDLQEMKKQLEENCIHYSNISNFEVKMVKPNPSSKNMTAYINVFEKRCLNKEAKNLSETKVNNMKLSCEPLYFSELKCTAEVYNALKYCIKDEIDMFLEKNEMQSKRYSLRVILGKDFATMKLSSDDIEVMKLVQMQVNHIINGIRLDSTNLPDIHKLFCHGGHMFLKTLGETEKVHIITNYEAKIIRLIGPQENCNSVRQYILNFIQDTENEVGKNIILCSDKQNRLVLRTIIMQYGANLEKFIESCGLRSAALNLKTSCLSLYGNRESVETAEECIRKLSGTVGLEDTFSDSSSEECPVCFMPADSLSYRLQHCGHLYCSGCIKGLVDQAQFPIQCCAENCSKPITLGDIKYIMNDNVAEINALADKSLKAYLDRNRDKIYYCPAADCSMFIYNHEISETKWNCPLCKNYICISCNVVYHEGFSCDMYRGSKEDPDYSFKVWQKDKTQCKLCPKCKTAIEKRSGCNRMTCATCKTNFCWICLQPFSSAVDAYSHIDRAHPGLLFVN